MHGSRIVWLCLGLALGCSADADQGSRGSDASPQRSAAPRAAAAGASATTPLPADNGFGNSSNPVVPMSTPVPREPDPVGAEDECASVSQQAENRLQPADIIFGIDTSGSMSEEIGFVQENMNAFSQRIIDSGVDVRVILVARNAPDASQAMMDPGFFGGGERRDYGVCIDAPLGSGSCPADSNPPVYTHVGQEVGSHDVLDVLINSYPSYSDQLREDSLKTFVTVTDDDANEAMINTADAFLAAVGGLGGGGATWSNWRYSSIYCFTDCAQAANIGRVHEQLVQQTGGVAGDLCLQDFEPVFQELARQVLEGVQLACDWAIPEPPQDEAFDDQRTNVQLVLDGTSEPLGKAASAGDCGDREGWHYDDESAPTRIMACPATCERIQAASLANVDILFGCETELIPPG